MSTSTKHMLYSPPPLAARIQNPNGELILCCQKVREEIFVQFSPVENPNQDYTSLCLPQMKFTGTSPVQRVKQKHTQLISE